MRIWHKYLLSSLPDQWMVAQWRECCAIARNIDLIGTPNHILVNRIMDYPISHFYTFSNLVLEEMNHRNFITTETAYKKFEDHIFNYIEKSNYKGPLNNVNFEALFYPSWHNTDYLFQCASNLQEKYDCGGMTTEEWERIEETIRMYV